MSSRLFQTIREDAGLAYSVYSTTEFHRDSGMLSVHLAVGPDQGREALELVRRELDDFKSRGARPEEVDAAKAQLRGSLLMGQESVSSRMFHLAQEEIYCTRFTSAAEQVERIMAVTIEDVASVAKRYFDPGRFTLTALGPKEGDAIDGSLWVLDEREAPASEPSASPEPVIPRRAAS
jgi:predicted Zn-dependent peptidase